MSRFVSSRNLFEVDLPKGWSHNFENNIYTFYNEDEVEGVLQISPYFHKGSKEFNLHEELEKEKKTNLDSQIVELSQYGAIHYGIENTSERLLNYYWITGYQNVKIFCSLVINAEQGDSKLDDSYFKALEILNTLKINAVSFNDTQ
jgi:hypothetical protein